MTSIPDIVCLGKTNLPLSELSELARLVRVTPFLVFSRSSSFICTPPRANVYALFHMESKMSETQCFITKVDLKKTRSELLVTSHTTVLVSLSPMI